MTLPISPFCFDIEWHQLNFLQSFHIPHGSFLIVTHKVKISFKGETFVAPSMIIPNDNV
jgi:hypothetical protein